MPTPTVDADPHERFLATRRQTFGSDNCFICGRYIPVGDPERTREHVFPKWLLRLLDLNDGTLTSINRQEVGYRQLTVPCCRLCNGTEFSAVENRVKVAFEDGLAAVRALDRRDLFLWMGNIYYGIVFLESLRRVDVSDPLGPPLVPQEHLESIRFHHFLLQAASGEVSWAPALPGPASFLFYEYQEDPDNPKANFDYYDNLFSPVLAIRAGTIGVIAVLQDWGFVEQVEERHLIAASGFALHPTQFREIVAMVSYLSETNWVSGREHVIVKPPSGPVIVITPDVDRATSGRVEIATYAEYLASMLGAPLDEIYDGTSAVCFVVYPDGSPIQVPWPGGAFVGLNGGPIWPATDSAQSREYGHTG